MPRLVQCADLLTTDVNSHDSTKREDGNVVCHYLMGHKKCEFFGHVMILDSTCRLVYLDQNSCSVFARGRGHYAALASEVAEIV
jgi:hypothetical protein